MFTTYTRLNTRSAFAVNILSWPVDKFRGFQARTLDHFHISDRRGDLAGAQCGNGGNGDGDDADVQGVVPNYQIPNTKYTRDTGQTRNKLLGQWVHLANHAAGHSRPGTTHQTA